MAKSVQVHEDLKRQDVVRGSSDRAFGVVFSVVFLIVAIWPLWGAISKGADQVWLTLNWWALAVAGAIALAAALKPSLLGPANRIWLAFGLVLNRVVNPVVMAVLFFGVITPFGLVMRAFGKDPMRKRFDSAATTYWLDRTSTSDHGTMKNQF